MSKGLDEQDRIDRDLSRYSYGAKMASQCLQRVIQEKEIKEDSIPKPLYLDMGELFGYIDDIVNNKIPINKPLSYHFYLVGLDIVNEMHRELPQEKQEDCLKSCLNVFKTAIIPRKLSDLEINMAKDLAEFLDKAREYGERYQHRLKSRAWAQHMAAL